MSTPSGDLVACVQLSAEADPRARVRYAVGPDRFTCPIDGADADATSGSWRTAVTHRLDWCPELRQAWQGRDSATLWNRYTAAEQDRWAAALQEFSELLTEYDEPAVVFLRRYHWQRAVQPWTPRVGELLAHVPHTYRNDFDLFAACVPQAASDWLRTHWSLPQARSSMHLPGRPNDSSETLIVTLGLWEQTGGPMPSLAQALTTARHATFDVAPDAP